MKVDPISTYQFDAEKLEPDSQERVGARRREGLQLMSDEEEQQLLSDTATILKMDPPWDVTEDALHAAERALFAITKAVHHYKWHRQVLGDFWMARAVLVLKPYDAA